MPREMNEPLRDRTATGGKVASRSYGHNRARAPFVTVPPPS